MTLRAAGRETASYSEAKSERFAIGTLASATDAVFVDALTGSAMVGNDAVGPGPMLLTSPDELDEEVAEYLTANADRIERSVTFGGIEALSTAIEDAVIAALEGTDDS